MILLRGTKNGKDLVIQSPREQGDVSKLIRLAHEWELENPRIYDTTDPSLLWGERQPND